MTPAEQALRKAAALMADSLREFRGSVLDPSDLWRPEDAIALAAYETALMQINGAQRLPME